MMAAADSVSSRAYTYNCCYEEERRPTFMFVAAYLVSRMAGFVVNSRLFRFAFKTIYFDLKVKVHIFTR